MAGSRVAKIGNIFSRTTGLLRTGAIEMNLKPIWYDVYEAFPPTIVPEYNRPIPDSEIRKLFYQEDLIRAQFYKKYGSPGLIELDECSSQKTLCEKFVICYTKLQNEKNYNDEEIMDATEKELETDGIILKKEISPEMREMTNPLKEINLADLFKMGLEEPKKDTNV